MLCKVFYFLFFFGTYAVQSVHNLVFTNIPHWLNMPTNPNILYKLVCTWRSRNNDHRISGNHESFSPLKNIQSVNFYFFFAWGRTISTAHSYAPMSSFFSIHPYEYISRWCQSQLPPGLFHPFVGLLLYCVSSFAVLCGLFLLIWVGWFASFVDRLIPLPLSLVGFLF